MVCYLLFVFPLQIDTNPCVLIMYRDSGVNPMGWSLQALFCYGQQPRLESCVLPQHVLQKILF